MNPVLWFMVIVASVFGPVHPNESAEVESDEVLLAEGQAPCTSEVVRQFNELVEFAPDFRLEQHDQVEVEHQCALPDEDRG